MKQIYFFLLLLVNCTFESFSQPFALALNNVNGAPYTCTWLDDLGTYKRLRVQANQNSSDGRWELPQTCAYPGNVWRPYTDAEATPIPFNVVIPPTPSTYTALWNANNGGAPGRLLPVTNGNYYTFNVENITCSNGLCNSPHIGVLETPYLPVTFPTVTQSPLADAVGQDMPVTITVTSSAPPIENVFLRYTINEYVNTTIVPVNFVGTIGTATIPGFPQGTVVKYYIYSSNKSQALIESEVTQYGEIVHDMSTLDWNVNTGSNYPYTVLGLIPVRFEYFRGSKTGDFNALSWKLSCEQISSATLLLERSSDGRNFSPIFTEQVDQIRCGQAFNVNDEAFLTGKNYYRVKFVSANGNVSFSQVVLIINNKDGLEITAITPNIISNQTLQMQVVTASTSATQLNIFDATGKIMSRISKKLEAGNNNLSIPIGHYAAGTYFLLITDKAGNRASGRFVIP